RRLHREGRGGRGQDRRRRQRHRRGAGEPRAPACLTGPTRCPARRDRRGRPSVRTRRRRDSAQVIVAAVDLGTNTTRLLVGRVEDGHVEELRRETRITRLGEGVDARSRLLPVPIARVRNALTDYRRTAESLGAERTLLVATSAVRDAENGEAFLGEIEWSYGFSTQLLSGDEEARLTRRGVGELGVETLLVDLGGGSTELVLGGFHTSLPMGSVRFTERHGDDAVANIEAARSLLPDLEPKDAVGVAATITSVALLDLDLEEYDRDRVH